MRYGVYFVSLTSDLCFSVIGVLHGISYHIDPCYSGTRLYWNPVQVFISFVSYLMEHTCSIVTGNWKNLEGLIQYWLNTILTNPVKDDTFSWQLYLIKAIWILKIFYDMKLIRNFYSFNQDSYQNVYLAVTGIKYSVYGMCNITQHKYHLRNQGTGLPLQSITIS